MGGWGKQHQKLQDLFLCECGNEEHQFIVTMYDFNNKEDQDFNRQAPEENLTFSLSVHLSDSDKFWVRLKKAFMYLLGYRSRYGHWDVVDLTYNDAQRIIDGMIKYRQIVQSYRREELNHE